MGKIDFQHQFSMSKIVQIFLNLFSCMAIGVREQLLLKLFLETSIFEFTKIDPKFHSASLAASEI